MYDYLFFDGEDKNFSKVFLKLPPKIDFRIQTNVF